MSIRKGKRNNNPSKRGKESNFSVQAFDVRPVTSAQPKSTVGSSQRYKLNWVVPGRLARKPHTKSDCTTLVFWTSRREAVLSFAPWTSTPWSRRLGARDAMLNGVSSCIRCVKYMTGIKRPLSTIRASQDIVEAQA